MCCESRSSHAVRSRRRGALLLPQFSVLGEGCVEAGGLGSSQDIRQHSPMREAGVHTDQPQPSMASLSQQGRCTLSQPSP